MEAPCNSDRDSHGEEERKEVNFDFRTCIVDSPRLLSRAALKISPQLPTLIDSTSLFEKMKTINTTINRLNRPRTLPSTYSCLEMDRRRYYKSIKRKRAKDICLHLEFIRETPFICRSEDIA